MHTHTGLRALRVLLLSGPGLLLLLRSAAAEISCRSCQDGHRWRPREFLLLKFNPGESARAPGGEVLQEGARAGAQIRAETSERGPDTVRVKSAFGEKVWNGDVSPVVQRRQRRGSGDDDGAGGGDGHLHPGPGRGGRVTRWSGARTDELKVNSSTFALTGDSSHNQAMVHWSGHNSSVILMLTKLFDFNLNSVTESSLWRSTDYGATYQKLNDKVGAKTILSYLYVSPNNKRKIMLLTDPEVESSLLISSDEGATYQKYRLSFYILSLLFHPEQEDWILAYSHEQKLYSSVEFGRRWQLVHERVAPNRFYWSKMGLDKEPGLIHLETSISDGQALYVTCKLQNCSEANKGKPFPGFIDPNSLVVQDEYVFVQVSTAGRPIYYVSAKRDVFTPMKLPKYTLPKELHVISTDENRVVAAVQEWNQNETYNLYVSDTSGVFYTLALENVVSSMGLEGNIMVDLYEVSFFFRESAPGIIVASGSIGAELTNGNVSVFITSDAGNTWRQIFDEEYAVLYLDQGGALVAIRHTPLPIQHLYLFDLNLVFFLQIYFLLMNIFGFQLFLLSQLVKIDFRSIFNRRCTEPDYQTWHLHNQGEPCLMGVKRIYRKLKPTSRCVMGKTFSVTITSGPCDCTESDFECDYGFERRTDDRCTQAFWFHSSSMSRSCSTGMTFLNSTGYRKVVSNNCTAGVSTELTARRQQCPTQAPKGLHLVTSEASLTATLGTNVTFLVFLEEGDGARTSITLDFGDGHALSYSNVSSIEDGIKHVYKAVGIYRVSATGENSLGSETTTLYLHVTCPLDHIHLSAPFVAVRNQEVNLTVVLWPSTVGTVTYIWWIGNNTEPIITLEGSVACTFPREGISTVTVQVSLGNTILQDRKSIANISALICSPFSSNLDEHNPDVAEWRLDVSRVIKSSLIQATGVREDQLLVSVLPGLPTAAEFFLLPDKQMSDRKAERSSAHLDQVTHMECYPTYENHSGSAMLMLLSVVVLGLAVFVIYKFKRKIPGLNVYAQMQNEKEQEMKSPANPTEATPTSQRDPVPSLEILDSELNSGPVGKPRPSSPHHAPCFASPHSHFTLILCVCVCSISERLWPMGAQ
uniref:VPS10 domain-containing receptor SorCS2 n=1 Tax=Gouania willdenowi TaxID=441366 RepID=A0A8C5HQ37_GOUWI